MFIQRFLELDLKNGEYICIMNEKGECTNGNYRNGFDNNNKSFKFQNHSNGKTDIIFIEKLQRLDINSRA